MEIKAYKKNAKKHPDSQLKLIAASLKRFGWQQNIKVGKNKIIIAGHGRWFAYKKYPKGIKKPWIINEEGKTISGCAEKRKLTRKEEIAYRIADNRIAESETDLGLIVDELKLLDDDLLDLTGYDLDKLDDTDADYSEANKEIDEDEIGDFNECPKCGFLIEK